MYICFENKRKDLDNTMEIKNKIEALRKELHEHNHNYYVLDNPSISDYEFDRMLAELQELEEKYPEYMDSNSPTMRVGVR